LLHGKNGDVFSYGTHYTEFGNYFSSGRYLQRGVSLKWSRIPGVQGATEENILNYTLDGVYHFWKRRFFSQIQDAASCAEEETTWFQY
jgi:hypothetical protein